MHYRNGREAKAGDPVVYIPRHGPPATGILYDPHDESDSCNGRLAVLTPSDPYVTIGECLHIDDVKAATEPPKAADDQPAGP